MRRRSLTFGILLILVSIFVLEEGAQVLAPVADLAGLSSRLTAENVILPPTLYSVPASNYTFATEDIPGGSQLVGSLEVGDGGQVAFYVMDEGNFSLWRTGHPASLVLARPLAVSYNFTLSLPSSGTYYFVFANHGDSPLDVIFSLSSAQEVVVLSPFVQYAWLELFLLGALFTFVGLSGGKPKAQVEAKRVAEPVAEPGWKCKFCGAENDLKERMFCGKCGRAQN
jgi:hypothetical protein